jgi:hypothetical protein
MKHLKIFEDYKIEHQMTKNDVKNGVIELVNSHNVKKFDDKEFDFWFNKLKRQTKGDNTSMLVLSIYDLLPDL